MGALVGRVFLVSSLVLSACFPVWGQPYRVCADLDRIEFRGVQAYTPEQIQGALRIDATFTCASRLAETTDQLAALLRERLLEGYRVAGFGNVQITATTRSNADGPAIIVDIEEGPRFTAGTVHVSGASDHITALVRRRLTEPWRMPAAEDNTGDEPRQSEFVQFEPAESEADWEEALWQYGKRIALHEQQHSKLRQRIEHVLADEGYITAKFRTRVEFDSRQAFLHVDVEDLGAQATIRQIKITGNKRHTNEQIVQYLGLAIGQPWTTRRKSEILHQLWRSARFREHRVSTQAVGADVQLAVDVREYWDAPRLDEELTREETALLKLRDWLVDGEGRSKEFAWSVASDNVECSGIASSTLGAIIEIAVGNTEEARCASKHTIVLDSAGLSIYAMRKQMKFTALVSGSHVRPYSRMSLLPTVTAKKTRLFEFGWRVKSLVRGETTPSVAFSVTVAPVYFLAMAHERTTRLEWHDDVLTVHKDDGRIRVDGRTGELLESVLLKEGQDQPWGTSSFVTGVYQQRLAILHSSSRNWRTFPDPTRILSSSAEFFYSSGVVQSWCEYTTGDQFRHIETIQLAHNLVRRGLLEPLEPLLHDGCSSIETGFCFPQPEMKMKGITPLVAGLLFTCSDYLFADGEWPWLIWREVCYQYSGTKHGHTAAVVQFCSNDRVGPLACYAAASLIGPQSNSTRQLATLGLTRLEREDFLRDCGTLLDENTIGGTWGRRCCEILTQLSPSEIELLESYLGCPGVLARVAAALASHADSDQRIEVAAGELWDSWLRQELDRRLRRLQGIDTLLSSPFPLPDTRR